MVEQIAKQEDAGEVQQQDCEFKILWNKGGTHLHCTLFVRQLKQVTWQNCGVFVIGDDQLVALSLAMPNVNIKERSK